MIRPINTELSLPQLLVIVLFTYSDRSSSQTIGATAGASLGDILVPQKDTLSNRVISFIASQIFTSNVAPQLSDVRFYLWTRFGVECEIFVVLFIKFFVLY